MSDKPAFDATVAPKLKRQPAAPKPEPPSPKRGLWERALDAICEWIENRIGIR
jgi:hypothetical protein